MALNISVPFAIMWDSGIQEGYTPESGPTATMKFRVYWNDRIQFIKDMIGQISVSVDNTGKLSTAATYPFLYPGNTNLIARSIPSIEPLGWVFVPPWKPQGNLVGGWIARQFAIVTVTFGYMGFFGPDGNQGTGENQQNDPSGKPYTSTSIQMSGELYPVPRNTFFFQQAPGAPALPDPVDNFQVNVGMAQITLKRYMLSYLPIFEVMNLLGKVNQYPLSLGNFGMPAGTVIFNGGSSEVSLMTDGTVTWTVEYLMNFRQYPWNQALNKRGQWANVVASDNKTPPFPSADFSILP